MGWWLSCSSRARAPVATRRTGFCIRWTGLWRYTRRTDTNTHKTHPWWSTEFWQPSSPDGISFDVSCPRWWWVRDFWFAAPVCGPPGKSADWPAAWRQWVRRMQWVNTEQHTPCWLERCTPCRQGAFCTRWRHESRPRSNRSWWVSMRWAWAQSSTLRSGSTPFSCSPSRGRRTVSRWRSICP